MTGRNDPCPCGSGRKYKRCCLGRKPVTEDPAPAHVTRRLDDFSGLPEDVVSPAYWEQMEERLSGRVPKELAPLISTARQYAEYKSRREDIEAAVRTLESHRTEYEELARDPQKLLQRTEKLFDEEQYADMWFSAADVQRAFEEVGYPVMNQTTPKSFQSLEKAIRFLADDTERETLARRLMLMLPDHVNARRYLDAWMIQHSALITRESTEGPVGSFLLAMFMHGMKEWGAQRDREQVAMFRNLGIDLEELRRLGYGGSEAWLKEIMEDPSKAAELENFLAAHPELKAFTEAQCRDAEEAALALLKREDALDLLLSLEEAEPWFEALEQRLSESPEILAALKQEQGSHESAAKVFLDRLYSVSSDMAAAVFTEARLDRLASLLHEYRGRLSEEDQDGIAGVHGALVALQSKQAPGENHFLVALCWESVRRILEAVKERVQG